MNEKPSDRSNVFQAEARSFQKNVTDSAVEWPSTRNEIVFKFVVEIVDFLTTVKVVHILLETYIDDADIILVMSLKKIFFILQ